MKSDDHFKIVIVLLYVQFNELFCSENITFYFSSASSFDDV